MIRRNILRGEMNTEQLTELSFILYFSYALIRFVLRPVLGNTLSGLVASLIPYIPLAMICVIRPQKYIKLDFIALYLSVIVFFMLTLLIHPKYDVFYSRNVFGVWDHVLKPYRGIYAYLFIRIIDDPKRILKCMKKVGWILMVYFVYEVVRGEWTTVTTTGFNKEASYSVEFGYEVLIFALTFLYSALTEKHLSDIIAASVDIVLILVGGSRGPILFIGLFLVLYIFLYNDRSYKKFAVIVLVCLSAVLLYLFYIPILLFISRILDKFGMTSRFIKKMLNGTITDDNNRTVIWNAAIQMIKDNPFGYGAMGSRHVIYKYIIAGYPHSIILEFLIDYGVFAGGFFLLSMLVTVVNILFTSKYNEWRGVFLTFFSAACCMLISLTYWSRFEFWSCLALSVCCYQSKCKKVKEFDEITT